MVKTDNVAKSTFFASTVSTHKIKTTNGSYLLIITCKKNTFIYISLMWLYRKSCLFLGSKNIQNWNFPQKMLHFFVNIQFCSVSIIERVVTKSPKNKYNTSVCSCIEKVRLIHSVVVSRDVKNRHNHKMRSECIFRLMNFMIIQMQQRLIFYRWTSLNGHTPLNWTLVWIYKASRVWKMWHCT